MGKKILVTSIPSWNQKTGSNTFSMLFDSFDRNDLANIYVAGDIPDSPVCSRYFHIDETKVVKSVIKRGLCTGEEVSNSNNDSQRFAVNRRKQIKRTRFKLWAREIAWKFGCWKSKELKNFLKDLNPEVLVFPIESYLYFNRLNKFIIHECKPQKVIGYLWDDNFTYKQHPHSVFAKIERYFVRRQVKQLISVCTHVMAISSKMKKECDAEFGTDCVIMTKPIFSKNMFKPTCTGIPIHILYTGKLIIGREFTIAKIAAAIKEINKDAQKVVLDIYTNTVLSDNIKDQIDIPNCCILHAPVPQSEVATLQEKADILLFVESLSEENLTARLSFSTKLTDYFAAGKCVWAVGNLDLGPISYIQDENAGLISYDDNSINDVLRSVVSCPSLINEYARKSYECGKRNHNGETIIRQLKEVIGYDENNANNI